LLSSVNRWLGNDDDPYYRKSVGTTRYLLPYFESLLPFVDLRVWDAENHGWKEKTDSGIRISQAKDTIKKIIRYAHKGQTDDAVEDEKIEESKKIFSILDSHKETLGDFSLLVKKTLSEKDD